MATCHTDGVRGQFDQVLRQARRACNRASTIVLYGYGSVFPRIRTFLDETGNAHKLAAIVDDSPSKCGLNAGALTVQVPTREKLADADVLIFTFPEYNNILERFDLHRPTVLEGDMLEYALTVAEHSLNTICWMATSACNSRCTICGYWRSEPVHLDPDLVAATINAFPQTNHHLLGGEFFCHPHWQTILRQVHNTGYVLVLTNGLDPAAAWAAHDEFGITRYSISLDGGRESYRRIRGLDAYDTVVSTIRGLARREGTSINLAMVITPFSTLEDFHTVENLCKELGLYFSVAVYYQWEQFDRLPTVDSAVRRLSQFADAVNASEVLGGLDRRFLNTYMDWRAGKLSPPCTTGMTAVVINERGDVLWCTHKPDPADRLGNIGQAPLADIVRSDRFDRVAGRLYHCNDCWSATCRRFDLSNHLRHTPTALQPVGNT